MENLPDWAAPGAVHELLLERLGSTGALIVEVAVIVALLAWAVTAWVVVPIMRARQPGGDDE